MKKIFILLLLALTANLHLGAQQLETVFEDSTYQLTGVAVSQSGRLFVSYPRWDGPYKYALVEIVDGRKVPYPNAEWNRWKVGKGGDKQKHFVAVQAVFIDPNDDMWVVDPGYRADLKGQDKGQKLVRIDLKSDKVVRVYPLSSVAGPDSYLNDIRIDTHNDMGYITNSREGGIVVVNLKTGAARQVLLGSDVTKADTSYVFRSHGKPLMDNGRPYRGNADGIAISPDMRWLYFKALTDDRLFRVPTAVLNDSTLTDSEIEKHVEMLGRFTATDGMEFDPSGNLYLGDQENRRIVRVTPDLRMEEVVPPDSTLTWPDSYQWAGGYLYISFSKIDDEPRFHNGVRQPGNYKIMRMKVDLDTELKMRDRAKFNRITYSDYSTTGKDVNKVLVISASPNRGGNTDLMADAFIKGAEETGQQVEKVFLYDKKINFFTMDQLKEDRDTTATPSDDAREIIEKMRKADVIVLASPVYFWTIDSKLKTLIDRTFYCFRDKSMSGKEFYYLTVCGNGNNHVTDGAINAMRGFLSCLNNPVERGMVRAYGVGRSGYIVNTPFYQQAYELGKTVNAKP
jgi:multimeric flavodoxin WrbA/sugar lactone lactonase YvrE